MKVNLGINKLMLLFSKGKKAVVEACQNRKFLTLVNHKDLLKRIEHEGYGDHDGPNAHAGTGHPEHKEGDKDLFGGRFSEFPGFLFL